MSANKTAHEREPKGKIMYFKKLRDFSRKHDLFSIILTILFMVFIRTAVLGNYSVDTGSMNPTIREGDKFFSNNAAYSLKIPFTKHDIVQWDSPSRGDIIAFRYPGDESVNYTKRVIGVPGDEIAISGRAVYINGKKISRSLISRDEDTEIFLEKLNGREYLVQNYRHAHGKDTMKKFTVPQGALFVMGDNRDNSFDSRYWGFVPIENVLGKLVFRWTSIDPDTWSIRWERIGRL